MHLMDGQTLGLSHFNCAFGYEPTWIGSFLSFLWSSSKIKSQKRALGVWWRLGHTRNLSIAAAGRVLEGSWAAQACQLVGLRCPLAKCQNHTDLGPRDWYVSVTAVNSQKTGCFVCPEERLRYRERRLKCKERRSSGGKGRNVVIVLYLNPFPY